MPAVDSLTLNSRLNRAAQRHALDMKRRGVMGHVGSDGSSVGRRVHREGYEWEQVAENVAFGYPTATAVMAAWLKSESHCRSIFAAPYLHLGVGEVDGYWTQVFAVPR